MYGDVRADLYQAHRSTSYGAGHALRLLLLDVDFGAVLEYRFGRRVRRRADAIAKVYGAWLCQVRDFSVSNRRISGHLSRSRCSDQAWAVRRLTSAESMSPTAD